MSGDFIWSLCAAIHKFCELYVGKNEKKAKKKLKKHDEKNVFSIIVAPLSSVIVVGCRSGVVIIHIKHISVFYLKYYNI